MLSYLLCENKEKNHSNTFVLMEAAEIKGGSSGMTFTICKCLRGVMIAVPLA